MPHAWSRGDESFWDCGVAERGEAGSKRNGVLAALGVSGAGVAEVDEGRTAKGVELFDVEFRTVRDEGGECVVKLEDVGPVTAVGGEGEMRPAAERGGDAGRNGSAGSKFHEDAESVGVELLNGVADSCRVGPLLGRLRCPCFNRALNGGGRHKGVHGHFRGGGDDALEIVCEGWQDGLDPGSVERLAYWEPVGGAADGLDAGNEVLGDFGPCTDAEKLGGLVAGDDRPVAARGNDGVKFGAGETRRGEAEALRKDIAGGGHGHHQPVAFAKSI